MSTGDRKNNACFHCGEDCGKSPVEFDNKIFCCQGCRMVYEILAEKEACKYYDLSEHPGIQLKSTGHKEKFAYLENPDVVESLLDFSELEFSKVTFFIPIIHCSACIWLLENLYKLHDAISYSSVHFVKKEVYITFNHEQLSLRELVELLDSIGYTPQITHKGEDKKSKKNYRILYQIGVAGFAFGNIMLFSLPHYFSAQEGMEPGLQQFFAWVNLVLSLPVLFYADVDYFVSAFKSLRKKIINIDFPIALGIIAILVRSMVELITNTGPGYFDSLTGLVFFLLIGKWYQGKTYQTLSFERDYKSYFPIAVNKIGEDGYEESIMLKELKVGDTLLIRNSELIPADSLLISDQAEIDYSFVSGESIAVPKKYGDKVFAGGKQKGPAIKVVVEKEVEQSYLTRLWTQSSEQHTNSSRGKIRPLIDNISKYFAIAVLSVATITAIYWAIFNPSYIFNAFTSILIIACPCALALVLPFSYGNIMRILGKNGVYLKDTSVVEALSKLKHVVFDKTGTLTNSGDPDVSYTGKVLEPDELQLVANASRQSGHPLSVALANHLNGKSNINFEHFEEIEGKGIIAKSGQHRISMGSAGFIGLDPDQFELTGSSVFIKIDDVFKGYFLITNRYREGIEDVINHLKGNYGLHLLTGDNDAQYQHLASVFPDAGQLHFNQSPFDKLDYIQRFHAKQENVVMVGDGLNDAGALAESNVGISIADDIYHFSPACDVIMESGEFNRLHQVLDLARKSMWIVYICFAVSFIYNAVGLFFAVQNLISPVFAAILMPASSVMVVSIASLGTRFLAYKKGFKV